MALTPTTAFNAQHATLVLLVLKVLLFSCLQ